MNASGCEIANCDDGQKEAVSSDLSHLLDQPQIFASDRTEHAMRKSTKGGWTIADDTLLCALVKKHGVKRWTFLASTYFNSSRTPLQLRSRYMDILHPDRCRDKWSLEEDALLLRGYFELGSKWKAISRTIPGRVENDVKNRFYKIIRDGRRALVDARESFDLRKWATHYLHSCVSPSNPSTQCAVVQASGAVFEQTAEDMPSRIDKVSVQNLRC
mmetsp:Transcript_12217/g.32920  ORF Transcript_12217/g.32920 Transcript_12217/m.32920 type:complete len:215 (+) Transcript_12217:133-777(+)